ncbi:hypothetical protein MOV66_00720 [Agrobacterium sp. SHOUNA12C]|uniref:hypothetical protein n=1 Tax=Rhizobium rhizogenes TaxID=359 RepID=UPI001574B772|nr:hypothetical protein [Rhizobium rhizogenes]MCJ9719908.1 hypothetical protein [Agrobacterium sp. BETTINA12B]MCJ9755157.1 hypothetical protein [Agrobacterium sp. SHOUNA12C]NTF59470.1 hypothetical protein [Rhizobium rhizogenes]NTF78897.1 hypothetical protein [Rhizobium rhizogenes]NTF95702.1 hypothetical protein [Rhizobium rhizogenes]
MMRSNAIDKAETQRRLGKIGLELGAWHKMGYLRQPDNYAWQSAIAPRDANVLLSFSQRALEWLPVADQYVAAFDDSAVITNEQMLILEDIGGQPVRVAAKSGALLFLAATAPLDLRMNLSYFVYFCLLFGLHLYITATDVDEGPILGLVDEAAYFISRRPDPRQELFANITEEAKHGSPAWVAEYKDRPSTYS